MDDGGHGKRNERREGVRDFVAHTGTDVLRVAMSHLTATRARQERAQEKKQGSKEHL